MAILTQRKPPPDYMKDNVNNYFGTAPDRGSMIGPVLGSINSTDSLFNNSRIHPRSNTDNYWLSSMGSEGKVNYHNNGPPVSRETVFIRGLRRRCNADPVLE
jgi:hypothetical protein